MVVLLLVVLVVVVVVAGLVVVVVGSGLLDSQFASPQSLNPWVAAGGREAIKSGGPLAWPL